MGFSLKGVAVLRVSPGSPAAKAGRALRNGSYQPGDIITAVQGIQVDSVAKLQVRLDDFQVGQSVKVSIIRDDAKREVDVALSSEQQ
ncbi:MAG: PDZ domain-containing protein [Desulfuromonadales bacterium]